MPITLSRPAPRRTLAAPQGAARLRTWGVGLAAGLALALAGCGGGSDDDAGLPVNTQVNASAAWRALLTQPHSWTLRGTANSQEFELTQSFTPGAAGVFPLTGVSGSTVVQTSTLKQNGVTVATASATVYFNATTMVVDGAVSDDNTCSRFTMTSAPPTSTGLNTRGALYTSADLLGCTTGAASDGTTTVQWSVENEGSTIYFCSNATFTEADNTPAGTESDCISVTPEGVIGSTARVRINVPGALSLTLRTP